MMKVKCPSYDLQTDDLLSSFQNANFIYTTTGKIHIRCSIIAQYGSPGTPGVPGSRTVHPSSSGSSALLLGAEAALNKYRKARARLAAATKDLRPLGSGDRP